MPQNQISEKESPAPIQLFKAVFTHLLRGRLQEPIVLSVPTSVQQGRIPPMVFLFVWWAQEKNIELICLEEPSDEVG